MERYEAYKDSGVEWIGEIPEGWKTRRLKSLASNRVEPTTAESGTYIGLENVQSFTMKITHDGKPSSESEGILYDDKCVLFGKLRPYLAKVALPNGSGPCSSEFLSLTPNNFNRKFLAYLLVNGCFIDEVNSLTYGVRMPRAGWEIVGKINMPVPPLDEQRAIADFLDAETARIDGLVADCEREVGLLWEYRKAVVSEAVTKGLDPDAPMKDSGVEWIGEIPEGWGCSKLGRSIEAIQTGPFGSQLHAEDYVDDGEVFVVNPANIADGSVDIASCNRIKAHLATALSQHLMKKGEIVFGRRGEMGRCALVEANGLLCGTGSIKMSLADSVAPNFAVYYLQCDFVKKYLELRSVGTTLQNLNTSIIASIPFVNAPLDEQREIVAHLDAKTAEIDGLVEAKRQMAEKLREYRKSLVSEAVTGKFKVPGVA